MNAIGIKIKKADGNHDPCTSKFFGAPVLPDGWPEMFSEDIIFFGQIRLSDIAELDTENKLPHTGYLYGNRLCHFTDDTQRYADLWCGYRIPDCCDPSFRCLSGRYVIRYFHHECIYSVD